MKFYEDAVYIKMCERAVEIQKQRIDEKGGFRLHYGDYVCHQDDNGTKHICIISNKDIYYFGEQFGFVVFRQDQLLDLIYKNSGTISLVFINYSDGFIIKNPNDDCIFYGHNIEQCLLQVYMYYSHNKTWDSDKEEWV